MNSPQPGSEGEDNGPSFTPLMRLQLLREVTEEARVFRLGGEDKIRVATGTCETIATHTSHLSTLSNLLLSFLPAHLLPQLPPPSAPHGYPSSSTPASALARRQNFDYPPSTYPGAGSTARMNAAMGMVREHWELTRGGGMPPRVPKRKAQPTNLHQADAADLGLGGGRGLYTKKKQHHAPSAAAVAMGASGSSAGAYHHSNGNGNGHANGNGNGHSNGNGNGNGNGATNGRVVDHPMGTTAVESVKAKRGAESAAAAAAAAAATNGTASRANGNSTAASLYPGMASAEEYAAATSGGSRSQKRKVEEALVSSKRQKKRPEASPDVAARVVPAAPAAGVKPPRRAATKVEEPVVAPVYDDEDTNDPADAEDDGDGHVYCVCNQVSFGEMIGCDGNDFPRASFFIACLSFLPTLR
ncbi:hypothetical protein RQP46_010010 [Phenoliferia psychrophenolica]